jgi:CRP-like cAMP-binding protein
MVRSLMGNLGDLFQTAFVNRFALLARDMYFSEGEVLFHRGDPSSDLYFLVEGEVSLDEPGEKPWRLGRSALLGIIDAQVDRPHVRTATALEEVHALTLTTEAWFDLVEDHFDLSRALLVRNARRLFELALEAGPEAFSPEAPALGGSRAPPARPLNPFERLLALRLSPPFLRAGMQSLIRLARASETRALSAGEALFGPGDDSRSLFLMASGRVQARLDDPGIAWGFAAGELVGGFAAFARGERLFHAAAESASVVVEIGFEELDDVMEDHFDLLRSLQGFLALERERIQRMGAY